MPLHEGAVNGRNPSSSGFGTARDSLYPIPCIQFTRLLTREFIADASARLAGIDVGAPAHPIPSADFGLIGLAVMGQNLILNAADNGFTVCAFNRTTSKVDRFLANEAKGKSIMPAPGAFNNQVVDDSLQASPLSVPTPSRSCAPSSSAPAASCCW